MLRRYLLLMLVLPMFRLGMLVPAFFLGIRMEQHWFLPKPLQFWTFDCHLVLLLSSSQLWWVQILTLNRSSKFNARDAIFFKFIIWFYVRDIVHLVVHMWVCERLLMCRRVFYYIRMYYMALGCLQLLLLNLKHLWFLNNKGILLLQILALCVKLVLLLRSRLLLLYKLFLLLILLLKLIHL